MTAPTTCVAPEGKRTEWVCPGDVWTDRDKRMQGRDVLVVLIDTDGKAIVADKAGKRTRLSPRRMYRHSTGFTLRTKACPVHTAQASCTPPADNGRST